MISVTVICRNEEDKIGECLESVKWADEIIVVDGFSTDLTAAIARKFTGKVFLKEWEGFSAQRAFALAKAGCEWVFPLDADERCAPELRDEILRVTSGQDSGFNGYRIPRRNFFLGREIKHSGWNPDFQMRLFKKNKARVTPRAVHEGYEVKGKTGTLKNGLLHYTVTSIGGYASRIMRYSELQAIEKAEKRKIGFFDLFFRPVSSFLRQFFVKKGYLDGTAGLMITFFDVITNSLTYMKAWEIQNARKREQKTAK